MADASGLRFAYVGTTTYKPLREAGDPAPSGIDAVIAFGDASEYPDFDGRTFGLGGFTSTLTPEGPRIIRGGVALNARALTGVQDGFGRGQRRGGALLHELGHMVGLAHVDETSQTMNPSLTTAAPAEYATGDRNGLAKVGAQAGCFVVVPAKAAGTSMPPE